MTGLDHLQQWVGRTETREDVVAEWPARALAATLDRDTAPVHGEALPQAWHWLYFLEAKRASELGPDGHPLRGDFLPPVELPRRLWAGGRMTFLAPLRIGDVATRDSEILRVEAKHGRRGALIFVTVRHVISVGKAAAIVEEHDIVYREDESRDAPPREEPAPSAAAWSRRIDPDAVLLFRYSALTFNGYRLHYDRDYASGARFPGLIVHGPLQVTLMLELLRQRGPAPAKRIEYRALHPLFDSRPFTVHGTPDAQTGTAQLWTADESGLCAMRATARWSA
jgi:3-methylfumaryl-CoA hydratase